jgi:hypothetical protein
MRPNGEELLRGAQNTLTTYVLQEIQTDHARLELMLVHRLLGIAAEEWDGAAQRLVDGNAALRALARRGAEALGDEARADELRALAGETDASLRLSELSAANARLREAPDRRRQEGRGDALVDEQRLHRVAGGRPLALRVERNRLGHAKVRRIVHVDVADPLGVADDRHSRVLGDEADQRLAAARDAEVDQAVGAQELQHRLAVGRRHGLHRGLGQTRAARGPRQRLGQHLAGADDAADCRVTADADDEIVARSHVVLSF